MTATAVLLAATQAALEANRATQTTDASQPTPTLAPTFTPLPASTLTPTFAPTSTPTAPPTRTPTVSPTAPCAVAVNPEMAAGWDLATLGCATGNAAVVWAAWQPYERGDMLWLSDSDWAYALHWQNGTNSNAGDWSTDGNAWKWDGSSPDGVGLTPPSGLYEPVRGFGYVWRNFLGGTASAFGWATGPEKGFCANVQRFERGFAFRSSTVE